MDMINISGKFYHNELLCYLSHYIHNSALNNIKKIIIEFYTEDVILIAKKLLWEIGGDNLGVYVDRRTTERRSCVEASIDDITESLIKLDELSLAPNFVAINVENVPDRRPEELNFTYVLNRLNSIENKLVFIDKYLTENDENVNKIKHSLALSEQNYIKVNENFSNFKNNELKEVSLLMAQLRDSDFKTLNVVEDPNVIVNEHSKDINDSNININESYTGAKASSISFYEPSENIRKGTNTPFLQHFNSTDADRTVRKIDDKVQCDEPVDNSSVSEPVMQYITFPKIDSTTFSSVITNDNVDKFETYSDNENTEDDTSYEELLKRFNLLKNYDNNKVFHINVSNNYVNPCENKSFEEFLDNFEEENKNTGSLSWFYNYKDGIHEACTKTKYNTAVKNNLSSLTNLNSPKIPTSNCLRSEANSTIGIDKAISYSFPSKIVDENGFILKESKRDFKKRKLQAYQDFGICGPPKNLVSLFVYKLSKGEKTDVKNYVESKGIEVVNIEKKSHSQSKYNSFLLVVSEENKYKLLQRNFFPNGIKCKIWTDYRNRPIKSRSFINNSHKY